MISGKQEQRLIDAFEQSVRLGNFEWKRKNFSDFSFIGIMPICGIKIHIINLDVLLTRGDLQVSFITKTWIFYAIQATCDLDSEIYAEKTIQWLNSNQGAA